MGWIIPRRISLQHLKAVKCAALLILLLVIGRGEERRERGRGGSGRGGIYGVQKKKRRGEQIWRSRAKRRDKRRGKGNEGLGRKEGRKKDPSDLCYLSFLNLLFF